MTAREKVIKGLECCDYCNSLTNTCFQCPYLDLNKEEGMVRCTAELAHDALALLREQEPVEPKWTDFEDSFTGEKFKVYQCGNCGSYILSDVLYCPVCGRKVKHDA